MKIKTIELYEFEELNEKAKQKAVTDYNRDDELDGMEDFMEQKAMDLLNDNGFTELVEDIFNLRYELSYSQGSGAMFEFDAMRDGLRYVVRHWGHYSHERSTGITIYDSSGEELDVAKTNELEESVIVPMFLELKRYGYDYMETQHSFENVSELLQNGGYYFTSNGEMYND